MANTSFVSVESVKEKRKGRYQLEVSMFYPPYRRFVWLDAQNFKGKGLVKELEKVEEVKLLTECFLNNGVKVLTVSIGKKLIYDAPSKKP